MTFYGMHDAPGGNQREDTFLNENGHNIQVGDEKDFLIPWGCINPFIELELFKEGFLTDAGYTQNPDYTKFKNIIRYTNNNIRLSPSTQNWVIENEDIVLNSSNRLKQAYMAISMKSGDYIYIRGKKSGRVKIKRGWVFKIIEPTKFKYKSLGNSTFSSYFTLKAICEVPYHIYEKISSHRASIWVLNSIESNELTNFIN